MYVCMYLSAHRLEVFQFCTISTEKLISRFPLPWPFSGAATPNLPCRRRAAQRVGGLKMLRSANNVLRAAFPRIWQQISGGFKTSEQSFCLRVWVSFMHYLLVTRKFSCARWRRFALCERGSTRSCRRAWPGTSLKRFFERQHRTQWSKLWILAARYMSWTKRLKVAACLSIEWPLPSFSAIWKATRCCRM